MPNKKETGNRCELGGRELRSGSLRTVRLADSTVEITRAAHDGPRVRRLVLTMPCDVRVELLPTKGLSVGEFRVGGRHVFWDPPFDRIIDPDELDLSGMMLINGEKLPGFRWVENFTGGVELLGLRNWGMPTVDPRSGELLPIHGTASNIPVSGVVCEVTGASATVRARFTMRDGRSRRGEGPRCWYERGNPLWEIARTITVRCDPEVSMTILDTITNRSDKPCSPDWGYHVQFRAEDGARLVIPSEVTTVRRGGKVPADFDVWRRGERAGPRRERGYLHKGCPLNKCAALGSVVSGEVLYRDGARTTFLIPAAPYVQSWFSSGGSGADEFALPEDPNADFMKKPWNGFGPEIGASALDHDGDVDPSVIVPILRPTETLTLGMKFTPQFP